MKVLVTGGAGFIGSHLVEELLKACHQVVALDDLSAGSRENLPHEVSLLEVDIRDQNACKEAFLQVRPECVFHLAAQVNVRRSIACANGDAQINILGTLNVLEAAASNGVRRVAFASSGGAVYGDQFQYPCLEESLPRPSSPYGIAKLAGEQYGRFMADRAGMEFTVLRLSNVYGPRQSPSGEAGVVSIFLNDLATGQPATIFGDGKQTRDFVWVGDVACAFRRALEGPPGTYNIGSGCEVSILDLLGRLEAISGFSSFLRYGPPIRGEVRRNVLSCDRARECLGWAPKVCLEEGLELTVKSLLAGKSSP